MTLQLEPWEVENLRLALDIARVEAMRRVKASEEKRDAANLVRDIRWLEYKIEQAGG